MCAADMLSVGLEIKCALWSEPVHHMIQCRMFEISNQDHSPDNIAYIYREIIYDFLLTPQTMNSRVNEYLFTYTSLSLSTWF